MFAYLEEKASELLHRIHDSGTHEKVQEIKNTYKLQPLDVVLFAGDDSDPVSVFIKSVTLNGVLPRLTEPFHQLWTHSGILVDKTVMPDLDFLEDGKMYIWESVFSGQVLGYLYSGVLPLDHIVDKNGFHLGPQIREFDPVAAEGTATIGICPLTQEARHQVEKKLRVNPYLLKGIYEEFRDYTYPIPNVLPIVASAEDGLYKQLQEFKKTTREWFPFLKDEKRKEIFCSEMVARVLQLLELPTFVATPPESICPLELEVCPEFGGKVYYVKEFKKLMMVDERVSTVSTTANAFQTLEMESKKEHWVPRSPDSGVPPNAIVGGRERDGTPVHIARVQIGDAHYIGKIAAGSTSFPHMTYFGTEVQIHFKYEVLVESGFTWSPASGGLIPLGAVKAGVDLHGEYVYVARAAVGDGFFERLVEAPVHLPGVVSPNLKGARIAHDGEEVHVDRYEVLCHKGSEE